MSKEKKQILRAQKHMARRHSAKHGKYHLQADYRSLETEGTLERIWSLLLIGMKPIEGE